MSNDRRCITCRNLRVALTDEPCMSCFIIGDYPRWEPHVGLSDKAQQMVQHITASKWMLGASKA